MMVRNMTRKTVWLMGFGRDPQDISNTGFADDIITP